MQRFLIAFSILIISIIGCRTAQPNLSLIKFGKRIMAKLFNINGFRYIPCDVSFRDQRAAYEIFEKELEISRLGIQLLAFNLCRNFKNPF